MTLTLGGILFQDFEIPEQINFGGRQSLTTHRLPGGARVVDAMGRDDDDIRWSGRFRSASAGRRARSLDFLRAAGKPVTLAWDAFRYTVVVSEFQADFRQAYEIPYAVSCHVVTPSQDPLPGLADLLLADASAAFGLSATLTVAGLADAVGDVQSAVAAAKALRGGFPAGLAGVEGAVGAAQAVVGNGIAAAEGVLGTTPGDFADAVNAQAAAASQLSDLTSLAGSLGRMAANARGFR